MSNFAMTMDTDKITFESLLLSCPDFRKGLLQNLTATYASVISKITKYSLSKRERRMYLNPLRDFPKYMDWIEKQLTKENRVSIVGMDMPKLLYRIRNPIKFWRINGMNAEIKVWIACSEPMEQVVSKHHAFQRPDNHITGLELPMKRISEVSEDNWKYFKVNDDPNLNVLLYYGMCDSRYPLHIRLDTYILSDEYTGVPIIKATKTPKGRLVIFTPYVNIYDRYFVLGYSKRSYPHQNAKPGNSIAIMVDEEMIGYDCININIDENYSHEYRSKNMDPATLSRDPESILPYIRYLF